MTTQQLPANLIDQHRTSIFVDMSSYVDETIKIRYQNIAGESMESLPLNHLNAEGILKEILATIQGKYVTYNIADGLATYEVVVQNSKLISIALFNVVCVTWVAFGTDSGGGGYSAKLPFMFLPYFYNGVDEYHDVSKVIQWGYRPPPWINLNE